MEPYVARPLYHTRERVCYTPSCTSASYRAPPMRLQLLHITSFIVWAYPVSDRTWTKNYYVYVTFCGCRKADTTYGPNSINPIQNSPIKRTLQRQIWRYTTKTSHQRKPEASYKAFQPPLPKVMDQITSYWACAVDGRLQLGKDRHLWRRDTSIIRPYWLGPNSVRIRGAPLYSEL